MEFLLDVYKLQFVPTNGPPLPLHDRPKRWQDKVGDLATQTQALTSTSLTGAQQSTAFTAAAQTYAAAALAAGTALVIDPSLAAQLAGVGQQAQAAQLALLSDTSTPDAAKYLAL